MIKSSYKPFFYLRIFLALLGYVILLLLIHKHFNGAYINLWFKLLAGVLPLVILYVNFKDSLKQIIIKDHSFVLRNRLTGSMKEYNYSDISSISLNFNPVFKGKDPVEELIITFSPGMELSISKENYQNYDLLKEGFLPKINQSFDLSFS